MSPSSTYNHDIDVAPEYAALYPKIKSLLRDEVLIKEFHAIDAEAQAAKRRFETTGAIGVVLGLLPLLLSPLLLSMVELPLPLVIVSLVIDGGGVVALILVAISRFREYRDKWRRSCFVRERMRQWHFQLFLDGHFVELASSDHAKFTTELQGRWAEFMAKVQATHIHLANFLEVMQSASELYVTPSPYTDAAVAGEVWRSLVHLRFEHQVGFAGIQIDPAGGVRIIATSEKGKIIESVGTMSLLIAIGLTVVFFATDVGELAERLAHHGIAVAGNPSRVLLRIAMFFTALSAGARAFRSGYTIPEETESYNDYRIEILQLQRLFEAALTDDKRLEILTDLEREAARELRRFLKMKARASFLS